MHISDVYNVCDNICMIDIIDQIEMLLRVTKFDVWITENLKFKYYSIRLGCCGNIDLNLLLKVKDETTQALIIKNTNCNIISYGV